MHNLVKRQSASQVGNLVQSLEADFELVASLRRASPLLEHAIDEVDIVRARQHHEEMVVRMSDAVPLTIQVRVGVIRVLLHAEEC